MDVSGIFTFLGGLTYISFTIYRANQEQVVNSRSGLLRWLLYGVAGLIFLYGLFILEMAVSPLATEAQLPPIDQASAVVNFVLTTVLSGLSVWVISSASLRARIRRILPADVTYNPESIVHTTAWVLMFAIICVTVGNFVSGGGLAGLAQSLQSQRVDWSDLFFEDGVWVFAAVLGVGLAVRRTPQQVRDRLGIRLPIRQDITWGAGIGLLLFGVVIATSLLWSQVVSPQELQQQTAASDQLAQSFNSLPLAFITSAIVAIGEEIFFRGALQPVFGVWVTSLFFAVLHTQYTLTPATVIIFITSLGLGWLRQRYSTSASIIGHFVYNFIQLALAVLLGTIDMRLMSLLPLLPLLLTLHVTGFVRDGEVEILFPEAIRFRVNLTVPVTNLTSASLTITPDGHPPISILVDPILSALVYSEPQGRIAYNWHIPLEDPLPLFTNVSYQWSFTASDGSVGTLRDSFIFTDPRVDWARTVDAKNQFSIAVPRSLNPLLSPLLQVNTLLSKNTGFPLHENVILYDGLTPDCIPYTEQPDLLIAVGTDSQHLRRLH